MAGVATAHLIAGLPASGKTTLARALAEDRSAVRFTLDEWMLRLYGLSFDDPSYGGLASRCQELIWDVARQVLATGTDVILDWSMWSRARRRLWADRVSDAGFRVVVHHVATAPEVAAERAQRRADPYTHRLEPSDVAHMVGLLEPPDADEGFELMVHRARLSVGFEPLPGRSDSVGCP